MSNRFRKVTTILTPEETFEGAGFPVKRPFPSKKLKYTDPFLLLDEFGPIHYKPGEAKGAPDHPHRGFETVTYILEGEMEHKDSRGNHGKLSKGMVQWMTAGSGVMKNGGLLHGLQLWVNLPKKDKLIDPRYQEFPAEQLPQVETPDKQTWVKIIAGTSMGKTAIIETRTRIKYLHIKSKPNSTFIQPLPEGFNVFVYVLKGEGKFGPPEDKKLATEHQFVQFEEVDGDVHVVNDSAEETLDYLLIGGTPLKEPIARHGPFVMNTQEEIRLAWKDFYGGLVG